MTINRLTQANLVCLIVSLSGAANAEISFEWATVGNAGNAPDPLTGFGAVNYEYRIAKHEVTNAQYAEFLNNVDPTGVDPLNLYSDQMDNQFGYENGLSNTGLVDGSRYFAKPGWENARISSLLQWSPAETTASGTKTHLITLDEGARRSLMNFAKAIEKQISQLDEADPRRTYRQKWPGHIARIAAVIHCLEVATTDDAPHAVPTSKSTMANALALAGPMLDQADAALDMLGQDLVHERMRRILKRVNATGQTTKANLWRNLRRVKSLFQSKEQYDNAIELLTKNGYLAWYCDGKTEHIRLTEDTLEALPTANRAHRGHAPENRNSKTVGEG